MRHITHIIIHESDSTWGDAEIINIWHLDRGWSGNGYHKVILNGKRASKTVTPVPEDDGLIEDGRPIEKSGAHARGYNEQSIGICLIGKHGVFSGNQMKSLISLVIDYCIEYKIPVRHVLGHYETPMAGGKVCPEIEMKGFRANLSERMKAIGREDLA